MKNVLGRVAADRGEEFVDLAGATIRNISRGIIGIAILQGNCSPLCVGLTRGLGVDRVARG